MKVLIVLAYAQMLMQQVDKQEQFVQSWRSPILQRLVQSVLVQLGHLVALCGLWGAASAGGGGGGWAN